MSFGPLVWGQGWSKQRRCKQKHWDKTGRSSAGLGLKCQISLKEEITMVVSEHSDDHLWQACIKDENGSAVSQFPKFLLLTQSSFLTAAL